VQIQQDGHPIGELRRGSGLGEIALLHNGPRTASAVALTPVTLYSLDRESFLISLHGHTASFSAARDVADEHLARDADRSHPQPPNLERG
jgi:CRP-like cAMP-binding protein